MKMEKKKKCIYDEMEVDFLRGSRLVVRLCFTVKAF